MTPNKKREEILDFCRVTANWYLNTQCTEDNLWGGLSGSADLGRYIYQYNPVTKKGSASSVWGQGLALMGLSALARRLGPLFGDKHRQSVEAGARYLMSLQIMDQRDSQSFGGMRQNHPQADMFNPRDGASAAMAFCVLNRETGNEEYLYRAKLYADWYIRNGFDADGWPGWSYWIDKREMEFRTRETWQCGAGLMFYYLYKLTSEKRYLEEGLKPLMERYKTLCEIPAQIENPKQDDFAAIAALAACTLYQDDKLLDCVRRRMEIILEYQDEDGSCPYYDGESVYGLSWLNWIEFAAKNGLEVDKARFSAAIQKSADFIPSLQERSPADIRSYGGLYGQNHYGVHRTLIHHRATGYSLIFMLRLDGEIEVPAYNIYGWDA